MLTKAVVDKGLSKGFPEARRIASSVRNVKVARAGEETGVDTDTFGKAAELLSKCNRISIIYGEGILRHNDPNLITSVLNLAAISGGQGGIKGKIISLKPNGNSRGAWEMGLAHPRESVLNHLNNGNKVKAAYLLLDDESVDHSKLADSIKGLEYVVVQASHLSPATSVAHVVFPSPLGVESEGTYTTLDGVVKSAARLVQPPMGIMPSWAVIEEVSKRIKK
jgi:predicted molibdopterin-dependent oxidoreductase YjgC